MVGKSMLDLYEVSLQLEQLLDDALPFGVCNRGDINDDAGILCKQKGRIS